MGEGRSLVGWREDLGWMKGKDWLLKSLFPPPLCGTH